MVMLCGLDRTHWEAIQNTGACRKTNKYKKLVKCLLEIDVYSLGPEQGNDVLYVLYGTSDPAQASAASPVTRLSFPEMVPRFSQLLPAVERVIVSVQRADWRVNTFTLQHHITQQKQQQQQYVSRYLRVSEQ